MNKILTIILILLFSCSGWAGEAGADKKGKFPKIPKYQKKEYFFRYSSFWIDKIEETKKEGLCVEFDNVSGQKYINFGKKINDLIKNKKIDEFIKHINSETYWMHVGSRNLSKDNESQLLNELKNRKGAIYEMIFDLAQGWTDRGEIPSDGNSLIDLSMFISMYEDWLEWKVVYYKDINQYDVWFSIPDPLITNFCYFHYRVIEIDGKMKIIAIIRKPNPATESLQPDEI